MKSTLAIAFLLAFAASSRSQTAVLDQSSEADINYVVNGGLLSGQIFVVGVSGSLTAIEVGLRGTIFLTEYTPSPRTLDLDVVRLQGGTPSTLPEDNLASVATTFESGTFPPVPQRGDIPPLNFQWVKFDLPSLNVHQGDKLAFLIPYDDFNQFQWATSDGDKYTGGDFYAMAGGVTGLDALFRTYVVPVPEPNSICLVGFTAIIAFRRIRRRRTTMWR